MCIILLFWEYRGQDGLLLLTCTGFCASCSTGAAQTEHTGLPSVPGTALQAGMLGGAGPGCLRWLAHSPLLLPADQQHKGVMLFAR